MNSHHDTNRYPGSYPGRSPVIATDAMACTSQPMATQTALQVLRDGGNALDAAIAASATLAVVESYSTGIGGDCFILYHENATGRLHALNGSGRAPAAADIAELRARGHHTMPDQGILSVTVPGAVDAWHTANAALGRLPFADLLAPAIHYARHGYAVTPVIARHWQACEQRLAATPEAAKAYLIDGKAPAAGTVHSQPDLAASLQLIAEQGRDAFYHGDIAREIVRYSDALGGLLSLDDFANHAAEWVTPISTEYRGTRICQIPPNSQGVTVLMALNILAQTEVARHTHLSADHIHLLSEAFTLAMAERDRFVSDSAFNTLPVDELCSAALATKQFARIAMHRAINPPVTSAMPVHKDTVYLSVVDRERNACSLINSVFHSFGSGLVAGKTGINLQNRGGGFRLDDRHFNRLEGGKRPLHTLIPAMAYRQGRPILSFGVMGGQYQAMGQLYLLSNWLDYHMDVQQALDAPRFFPLNGELSLEHGIPNATAAALAQRGHTVSTGAGPHGGGQAIMIDWARGVLHGGSDPRKDGHAGGF